jgi:hypothetical protein
MAQEEGQTFMNKKMNGLFVFVKFSTGIFLQNVREWEKNIVKYCKTLKQKLY